MFEKVCLLDIPKACEVTETLYSQVPIEELLNDVPSYFPPLVADLELPASVDEERIQINTTCLRGITKVAGLGPLAMFFENGQTTQYEYAINSLNPDGSASVTSAKATQKVSNVKKTNLVYPNRIFPSARASYGHPIGEVIINKDEVADRVTNRINDSDNCSSEKAWATELDEALRVGLAGLAKQNCFRGDNFLMLSDGPIAANSLFAMHSPTPLGMSLYPFFCNS